ncbi:MAG TPA: 5-formyltetrahydrofolate cyclo-ligase [Acidothermaceae bacterium]
MSAKDELRREVLASRAGRPPSERTAVAAALAQVFSGAFGDRLSPEFVVAVYISISGEPETGPLLEALGPARVIVPVLLPDRDLDWVVAGDPGATLGVEAIASATVVLVPAVAVDRNGHRLGRGGGSYDRALTRVPDGRPVLAVVHDEEVLEALPVEPHDVAVGGALTPSGVLWFGGFSPAGHG